MKTVAKVIGLFFLTCVLIHVIFAPRCDSGSKSVRMARALSQERLSSLYDQMKSLRREIIAEGDHIQAKEHIGFEGAAIPPEFLDLKPRKVRPCNHIPNMMLEGCFDEFVYLKFFGIGEESDYGDHSPRIELRYANDAGPEILWRAPTNK